MAENNKLLARDFEKLLGQLSEENQKKIIEAVEAGNVDEIAKILGSNAAEAGKYLDAGRAYSSGPSSSPETPSPVLEKEHKPDDHPKHVEHYHAHSESLENNDTSSAESAGAQSLAQEENASPDETRTTQLSQTTPVPHPMSVGSPSINRMQMAQPNIYQPRSIPPRRRRGGGIVSRGGKSLAKKAGKQAIKKGATSIAEFLLANPLVLAAIAAVVGIIFLVIIILANICELTSAIDFIRPDWVKEICVENDTAEDIPPPPKGVTITKEALPPADDGSIDNGESIPYRITVTYDSSQADIPASQMTLVDLPEFNFDQGGTLSTPSATAVGVGAGATYVWPLTSLPSTTTSTITTYTALITLVPTATDTFVINQAYILTSAGPPSNGITCSGGDYFACLRDHFNVTVSGTGNQDIARFIFNTLSIPLSYSKYLRLFRSLSVRITISPLTQGPVGEWAFTNTSGDITLYRNLINARQSTRQQYLIHESAHSISWTNEGVNLRSSLYSQVYGRGLDSRCFKYGPFIRTFPFSSGNSVREIFAESVADTLVCDRGSSCGGWGGSIINDFPRTCSNTYNFVTDNVLGPVQ